MTYRIRYKAQISDGRVEERENVYSTATGSPYAGYSLDRLFEAIYTNVPPDVLWQTFGQPYDVRYFDAEVVEEQPDPEPEAVPEPGEFLPRWAVEAQFPEWLIEQVGDGSHPLDEEFNEQAYRHPGWAKADILRLVAAENQMTPEAIARWYGETY